jgi:hypothetical protein
MRIVALVLALASAAMSAMAGEPAPTGTLRAIFLASNPAQGRVDAATGAVSGPAVDPGAGAVTRYSVRSASIGSRRAARCAG